MECGGLQRIQHRGRWPAGLPANFPHDPTTLGSSWQICLKHFFVGPVIPPATSHTLLQIRTQHPPRFVWNTCVFPEISIALKRWKIPNHLDSLQFCGRSFTNRKKLIFFVIKASAFMVPSGKFYSHLTLQPFSLKTLWKKSFFWSLFWFCKFEFCEFFLRNEIHRHDAITDTIARYKEIQAKFHKKRKGNNIYIYRPPSESGVLTMYLQQKGTRSHIKVWMPRGILRERKVRIYFAIPGLFVTLKSRKIPNNTNTWGCQTATIIYMVKKNWKIPSHKSAQPKRWPMHPINSQLQHTLWVIPNSRWKNQKPHRGRVREGNRKPGWCDLEQGTGRQSGQCL